MGHRRTIVLTTESFHYMIPTYYFDFYLQTQDTKHIVLYVIIFK